MGELSGVWELVCLQPLALDPMLHDGGQVHLAITPATLLYVLSAWEEAAQHPDAWVHCSPCLPRLLHSSP